MEKKKKKALTYSETELPRVLPRHLVGLRLEDQPKPKGNYTLKPHALSQGVITVLQHYNCRQKYHPAASVR